MPPTCWTSWVRSRTRPTRTRTNSRRWPRRTRPARSSSARRVSAGPAGRSLPRSRSEPISIGAAPSATCRRRSSPGIVLAGVALVALLIGEGVFAFFAAVVALIAQGELYGVMVKHHRQPATAVGLVSGALVLAGAYYHGEAGLLSMLVPRPAGDVPLVHDRPGAAPEGHRRQHRAHACSGCSGSRGSPHRC